MRYLLGYALSAVDATLILTGLLRAIRGSGIDDNIFVIMRRRRLHG